MTEHLPMAEYWTPERVLKFIMVYGPFRRRSWWWRLTHWHRHR